MTTTLNQREFALIWLFAMKELILVSSDDRNIHKINHGFYSYIHEEYGGNVADIDRLQATIKQIIDSDVTFSRTGLLQDYDGNMSRDFCDRKGVSIEIARLTVRESLLREEIADENKNLIASGLMVEFEELFSSLGRLCRKFKIT